MYVFEEVAVEDETLGSAPCDACKRETVVLSGASATPKLIFLSDVSAARMGGADGVEGGEMKATFFGMSPPPLPAADAPRDLRRVFEPGSDSVSGTGGMSS